MKSIILLFASALSLLAADSTNSITVTNWVKNENLRSVAGVEYNISDPAWKTIRCVFVKEAAGGIVARRQVRNATRPEPIRDSKGRVMPNNGRYVPIPGGDWVLGSSIFITNCSVGSIRNAPERGLKLMPTGSITVEGTSMALYDWGIPKEVPVITSRRQQ